MRPASPFTALPFRKEGEGLVFEDGKEGVRAETRRESETAKR